MSQLLLLILLSCVSLFLSYLCLCINGVLTAELAQEGTKELLLLLLLHLHLHLQVWLLVAVVVLLVVIVAVMVCPYLVEVETLASEGDN